MVLKSIDLLSTGFEGAEKILEISIISSSEHNNMLSITNAEWIRILNTCNCSILSQYETSLIKTYILSESALIITKDEIHLNTCGATRLLQCLTLIMNVLSKYSLKISCVQYERSNFLFTDTQPLIHRSFNMELQFLKLLFPCGHAFFVGSKDRPVYHVFVADLYPDIQCSGQAIELIMFDLDASILEQFYTSSNDTAEKMMKSSGIFTLLTGRHDDDDDEKHDIHIDAYAYEPCGLSINAVQSNTSYYYTIHVTPENEFSYVTVRASVACENYSGFVEELTRIFKPGRMALILYLDSGAMTTIDSAISSNIPHYNCTGRTLFELALRYRSICMVFSRISSSLSSFGLNALSRRSNSVSNKQRMDIDSGSDQIICIGYPLAITLSRNHIQSLLTKAILQRVSMNDIIENTNNNDDDDDDDHHHHNVYKSYMKTYKNETLFIMNIQILADRIYAWCQHFPRIQPYFEFMCNSEVGIILALNAIGCGFSCVSMNDIKKAMQLGISSNRMLFERVWKGSTRIKYASEQHIPLLSFSQVNELRLFAKYYPNAWLLLHVIGHKNDGIWSSDTPRGDIGLYGTTMKTCEQLLYEAIQMELHVVGVRVSFMNNNTTMNDFREGMTRAASLINIIRTRMNTTDAIVYISSRSLWLQLKNEWTNISQCLNELFDDDIRIIAEPSRYFVRECATLYVSVIGKRRIADGDSMKFIYYISDGIYGSLSTLLYEKKHDIVPYVLKDASLKYSSRLFGPTCDTVDCIIDDIMLPELQLNDVIYFKNIGDYSASGATTFNGIKQPHVLYMI